MFRRFSKYQTALGEASLGASLEQRQATLNHRLDEDLKDGTGGGGGGVVVASWYRV